MTREEADLQFNLTYYIATSVIAGLITGVFFSAVVALFTRSRAAA